MASLERELYIEQGEILYQKKPVEIKGDVSDIKGVSCEHCGDVLTAKLLMHNNENMFCLVSCGSHPRQVWTHLYKKINFGGEWDFSNADRRFLQGPENLGLDHEYGTTEDLDRKMAQIDLAIIYQERRAYTLSPRL